MAEEISKTVHTLPPAEAARWLGVDVGTIRSLVQARYLSLEGDGIPLAEIRAFQARNAEGGSGTLMGMAAQSTDIQALIDALDMRINDLSGQAHETFVRMVPDAKQWSAAQRAAFIKQAEGRFGAILAVVGHGSDVDEALQTDLQEVGASAAWAGASLPHLLLVLRISRDLLNKTALHIAEEGHGRWNAILASFSSRLFPAIDRLTDAISTGYWSALVGKYQEELDRLANLIESSSYGVYEADVDGLLQYVNGAFAEIVGHDGNSLIDVPLGEVLKPVSGSVGQLLAESRDGSSQVRLVVDTAAGQQILEIETVVRRMDDEAIGFAGIVRVGEPEVEHVDASVLVRHVFELRRSITDLSNGISAISEMAESNTPAELKRSADMAHIQAQRLMIVVDELDADRRKLQSPT